jgi:hypothetical protein
MPSINWRRFPTIYNRNDTHWYVSKIKTYTAESISQLRDGLVLLNKWFVDQSLLTGRDIKFLANFLEEDQTSFLSKRVPTRLTWNPQTELFYAFQLEKANVISEKNRPPAVLQKYSRVFQHIENGDSYLRLRRRYKGKLLNDIAANARNFISMYKKLGVAWVEEGRSMVITSAGEKLMSEDLDWRVVIEKQLIKWQLYNPTVPRRYRDLRIFPYVFLLELLLKLESAQISKQEYTLFVTKASRMTDIEKVATQLEEYRSLDDEQRKLITESLQKLVAKRPRAIYVELLDSASKEIGFFTLAGPLQQAQIDRAQGIVLADRDRAEEIITKAGRPVFIEFRNELDWFSYYGDWEKGPTVEDAIQYYADMGEIQKAEAVANLPQATMENRAQLDTVIKEKDVELWFLDRLNLVETGLRLYAKGEIVGHQYSTEIGTIDILALDSSGKFVVIEFKKDQSSDQTVGQLLRYVGWVHLNLARKEPVRGIIIASQIDEKTRYALIGTQNPKRDELFSVYQYIGIEKRDISFPHS